MTEAIEQAQGQAEQTTLTSSSTSSTPAQEQTAAPKESWLDRILGRSKPSEETQPASKEKQPVASEAKAEEKKEETEQPKPQGRFVTDEELARLIQAEVDRREAKRLAEQRRAEKEQLRKSDPFKYAEVEEQEAAAERFHQFIGTLAAEYDRAIVDPLILALPESERKSALEKAGPGIEGRKAVAQAALDALKRHYMAEGEKQAAERLRKDPAFRKQLLVELRAERQEPDLVPALTNTAGPVDMDTILRQAIQRKR